MQRICSPISRNYLSLLKQTYGEMKKLLSHHKVVIRMAFHVDVLIRIPENSYYKKLGWQSQRLKIFWRIHKNIGREGSNQVQMFFDSFLF